MKGSNVIRMSNCEVATYCRPAAATGLSPYLVSSDYQASLGVREGMVAMARELSPGESPSPGSLCLVWVHGARYLLRVVSLTPETAVLEDDAACKTFDVDDARVEVQALVVHVCACDTRGGVCQPVRFEAGASAVRRKARRRNKLAPVIHMGAWLGSHRAPSATCYSLKGKRHEGRTGFH